MARKRIHLVCNAHLDPVWRWPWEDGCAEAVSTYRVAADFCDAHPEFRFVHNEALLYRQVAEHEPALHARIQRLVAEGRWHIGGGAWLQPDVNTPSAETHVRMFLLARRWFEHAFGAAAYPRTAYNFDPFGHPEGFAQILAGCGMERYVFCRPDHGTWDLPVGAFRWRDRSGSEVVARRSDDHYLTNGKVVEQLEQWLPHYAEEPVTMVLWGIGNHGGGPSREEYAALCAHIAADDAHEYLESHPDAFFDDLLAEQPDLPAVAGEIQNSSPGCYTSMARVKRAFRAAEQELLGLERLAALAWWWGAGPYPAEVLERQWHSLLFNTFHDILPGSCLPSGEVDALHQLGGVRDAVRQEALRQQVRLVAGEARGGDGLVPVFVRNPHGQRLRGQVEIEVILDNHPGRTRNARPYVLREGRRVQSQRIEAETNSSDWRVRLAVAVDLAPFAVARYEVGYHNGADPDFPAMPRPTREHLTFANSAFELAIDPRTGLVARFGRKGGPSLVAKGAFQPVLFRDSSHSWVAGNPTRVKERFFIEGIPGWSGPDERFRLATNAEVAAIAPVPADTWWPRRAPRARALRVIEHGPLVTMVEAVFVCGPSWVVRRYVIRHRPAAFEIHDRWFHAHPDHLAKLWVPLGFTATETVSEAVAAAAVRTVDEEHREHPQQRWVAVRGRRPGPALGLVTTTAVGHSCTSEALAANVCRAPAYAVFQPPADMPRLHDRCLPRQDLGQHAVSWRVLALPRLDEAALAEAADQLALPAQPFIWFPSGDDGPCLGRSLAETITVDRGGVRIEAVKRSEDGDELIVRLREVAGRAGPVAVTVRPHEPLVLDLPAWSLRTVAIIRDHQGLSWRPVDLVERNCE